MSNPPSTLEQVGRCALSLPEASERPHFIYDPFRVRGKIFVTVPPDRQHLHIFVNEEQRAVALAVHAAAFVEKLWSAARSSGCASSWPKPT